MNHKVKLTQVKPGKAQTLRDWFTFLQNNEEVIQTLKEEGVFLEESFLFQLDEDWYCLYHMIVDDVLKESSNTELNNKHKEMLSDCLETKENKVLIGFCQFLKK